jgi:hypothetical protein
MISGNNAGRVTRYSLLITFYALRSMAQQELRPPIPAKMIQVIYGLCPLT